MTPSTRHEKILDRIKKLLSLANSSNEHEAALAAAQAAKLMMEHNIAEAQLDSHEASENVGEIDLDSAGKLAKWKGIVLSGLTQAFDCKAYSTRKYDVYKGKTVYKVVGQPSKTSTITYMYSYLVGEIDRLANVAYREEAMECEASGVGRPGARAWKNSFRVGAASVIQKRLLEERKTVRAEAKAAGQSLVRIDKDALAVKDFVKENVGNLRKSSAARTSSRSGYAAGKAAGGNVSLGGGKGLSAGARRLKG